MGDIEPGLSDPRPHAVASLRQAIAQTGALGYGDLAQSLQALLERFTAGSGPHIRIEVAAGRVTSGGRPLDLTNRELELCIALAVHHRPVPSERLAGLLFPDQPLVAGQNPLKVYVHRVREKVAADFISCSRSGYQLRADVLIDLDEFGGMLALLETRPFLNDDDRAALRRIVTQAYGFREAPVWRWQWFGSIEPRIAELASKAAARLASDAFERCATAELLELAQFIVRCDPCDEQGREIAIKAHLAAGRRREAIAEFQRYEVALQAELGSSPSAHLRELLETA